MLHKSYFLNRSFSTGASSIPASTLGVSDVSEYAWLAQVHYSGGLLYTVTQIAPNVLVVYIRRPDGTLPPNGDYAVSILRMPK